MVVTFSFCSYVPDSYIYQYYLYCCNQTYIFDIFSPDNTNNKLKIDDQRHLKDLPYGTLVSESMMKFGEAAELGLCILMF